MKDELPFISVIIPTYRRPRQLARCVEALRHSDYPKNRFEIVVVDDGSDGPLEEVIDPPCTDPRVTLLRQSHAGPAAARNYGANRAKGEYLAFTDDDCRPAPDWLRAITERLSSDPAILVGGQTVNALSENGYSSASQVILEIAYAFYNGKPDQAKFFASNNLAVPAGVFHSIGGFDPAFTTSEDRDLCDRWLRGGNRLAYAPDALVYHAHKLTLRSFWNQHVGYGRGAWRHHHARAQRGAGPFRPNMGFYISLLRRPLSRGLSSRGLRLLLSILVALVANAAGFAAESLKRRPMMTGHPGSGPMIVRPVDP
jgi:GT2 family glycosyltransferase